MKTTVSLSGLLPGDEVKLLASVSTLLVQYDAQAVAYRHQGAR
ncbi:Uncharacterized protein YR821_1144 [Yersinia ruckeri]|uniref:Uncharacterized protein n=1 Tax=Yersinia ruckeri TaxID=29486 RepID=A0A0A8VBM9_YERRU|nr:hypothetical protein yruck0001_18610 [Yersinia ruckeri ATCC 29473]QTD76075.1 Uncharacterized protein YR821_1144 [Yersinia ruckeri]CEK26975.1 hypothetical protein CSF007_6090 [Yersinia ruckeri]